MEWLNPPTYPECFETHSSWSLRRGIWWTHSGRLTLLDESQLWKSEKEKRKEAARGAQVALTGGGNVTENHPESDACTQIEINKRFLQSVMMFGRMKSGRSTSPIWACFLHSDRGDDTAAPPRWRWPTSRRWSLYWQSTDLGGARGVWNSVILHLYLVVLALQFALAPLRRKQTERMTSYNKTLTWPSSLMHTARI